MPQIKFSFVPERQLGEDYGDRTGMTISIYSTGSMIFGSEIIRLYEMDGKYIKLFADVQKRAVGWTIIEGKTDLDSLNDARQIKVTDGGIATVSIGRILKKLGIEKGTKFMHVPVKIYKSLLEVNPIYYIELVVEKPYKKPEEENE